MLCHEFEDRLTDYLDGALDVEAHKSFAEHALRCPVCHDLLSEVKNTLVACSASEAPLASAGLEARILHSTIGNVLPQQVRAPFTSRLVEWLRGALDPIVSPQLASVATMLLVAVFVLTNTVSTDGSVGGIYHASMQLAQQTAGNATKTSSDGVKEITNGVNQVIGTDKNEPAKDANSNQNSANQN